MPGTLVNIGKRLRKLREDKKRTLVGASRQMNGISKSDLEAFEEGRVKPSKEQFEELAHYYDVPVEILRYGTIGERLNALRKQKGETLDTASDKLTALYQEQIKKAKGKLQDEDSSNLTGVSKPQLQRLENDNAKPNSKTLVLLSEFYECTIEYILFGKLSLRMPEELKQREDNFTTMQWFLDQFAQLDEEMRLKLWKQIRPVIEYSVASKSEVEPWSIIDTAMDEGCSKGTQFVLRDMFNRPEGLEKEPRM